MAYRTAGEMLPPTQPPGHYVFFIIDDGLWWWPPSALYSAYYEYCQLPRCGNSRKMVPTEPVRRKVGSYQLLDSRKRACGSVFIYLLKREDNTKTSAADGDWFKYIGNVSIWLNACIILIIYPTAKLLMAILKNKKYPIKKIKGYKSVAITI